MPEARCDILIVGGGTGGVAAAIAATSMGFDVVLTEETSWIGGQLTSQAVPPHEHPWIEQFGCTASYPRYRALVRNYYRDHTPLMREVRESPEFHPGGGWVSRLCHEPRIGWLTLQQMIEPALASGKLDLRLHLKPVSADCEGRNVRSIGFVNLSDGTDATISALAG